MKYVKPWEILEISRTFLGNILFKILSKILANRLKSVLHCIISEPQSAFVKDRQILDGPLMINEMINWAKNKKKMMLMFKTDIAKAYDSVAWKYLDNIMGAMDFGPK